MSEIKTTIETNIMSISSVVINKKRKYQINFDKSFKGHVVENETTIEKDIDFIRFEPANLIATLIHFVPNFAIMYANAKDKHNVDEGPFMFPSADLTLLFKNSKVQLEREFHAAGEIVNRNNTDYILKHDKYFSDIVTLDVPDFIKQRFDNYGAARLDALFA